MALAALVDWFDPQPDDRIIPLGDFVDRGLDTKGVLDQLIALGQHCQLVPILGNHDEMMLNARESQADFRFWLECGGESALASYGATGQLNLIPGQHVQFLANCYPYYETSSHIFLHANYQPELPLAQQDTATIRWLSLRDSMPPRRHCSGKTVVVGHTPHAEILLRDYLVGLDTGVWKGGWLSAMDVVSGQVWQVNERGEKRNAC